MPLATRELQNEYQRRWIAARRDSFFADKQCVECGSTERLELDHKEANSKVTHRIWSWSKARQLEEIAKCQVLCRDCHLAKTIRAGERARGERSGSAKLTAQQVREIRIKFTAGATKRGLAREYGVDEKAVRLLLLGESWAHVREAPADRCRPPS